MRLFAVFLMVILGSVAPALADQPLGEPTGRVLLTISGNIDHKNASGKAQFDRAMLEGLGLSRYRTTTSWTEGKTEFEGVLVKSVLDAVGTRGDTVVATALNDYSIEIPTADFSNYRVLLAMKMDGKVMTARDKGPLWIVYPRDDHRDLQNPESDFKWVWQLARFEIK